jgi:hypothetical protein
MQAKPRDLEMDSSLKMQNVGTKMRSANGIRKLSRQPEISLCGGLYRASAAVIVNEMHNAASRLTTIASLG